MEKQSEIILSQQQTGLTKLSPGVIIKEQNRDDVLKHVALLLTRLAMLYQIPNWFAENSVTLAEWIIENYPCEEIETINSCLRNPPIGDQPNWRLTPDTVARWMNIELEKVAANRENETKKFKENFKQELPGVDYEAFKKRLEVQGIPKDERGTAFRDAEYLRFKAAYVVKQRLENLDKNES